MFRAVHNKLNVSIFTWLIYFLEFNFIFQESTVQLKLLLVVLYKPQINLSDPEWTTHSTKYNQKLRKQYSGRDELKGFKTTIQRHKKLSSALPFHNTMHRQKQTFKQFKAGCTTDGRCNLNRWTTPLQRALVRSQHKSDQHEGNSHLFVTKTFRIFYRKMFALVMYHFVNWKSHNNNNNNNI